MPAEFFIGLITHPATRFPESAGSDGLAAQLAEQLARTGSSVRVVVHATNDFDPAETPLTRATVTESIDAELDIERRWRTYLRSGASHLSDGLMLLARRGFRRMRFAPPWKRQARASGLSMVRRLINIEKAHVALIRQAVGSDAGWALILEDDAGCDDVVGFADGLLGLVGMEQPEGQPRYVNVSRSFDQTTLGITHLLVPQGPWGVSTSQMYATQRPVTNTVCAILYRTDFLRELLVYLDSIPLEPVVPIDWKVNEALMSMVQDGRLGPGDCWVVEPAPILQLSMVDRA